MGRREREWGGGREGDEEGERVLRERVVRERVVRRERGVRRRGLLQTFRTVHTLIFLHDQHTGGKDGQS